MLAPARQRVDGRDRRLTALWSPVAPIPGRPRG
jgi:hypothetical protein